jgi:2,3-bisphosphoglycerate-independent phosphoglycerate mutase
MMPSGNKRPCLLIIRDGWGTNPNPQHDAFNAVKLAKTPVADALMRDYPWTLIKTCAQDVGLPAGTMGNSEVGHQNIGAGRVVPQESLVMTQACEAGLEHIPAIRAAIERVLGPQGGTMRERALHLLGIASDAGVHGQLEHLYAILRACAALGLRQRVYLHLFTDGRDTGPFTGKGFLAAVEAQCRTIGVGRIATLCGRYYAMDRDHRWERVRLAYDTLTKSPSPNTDSFATAAQAIDDYYARPTNQSQQGDEFVTPRRVGTNPPVADGDSVIFFNYRGDRPRELSAAFVFPDDKWAKVKPSPDTGAPGFDRGRKLDLHFVTMTQYWEALEPFVEVAFRKPPKMVNIAGEWISRLGLRQFRCAETEKYPHVTFFFNDYRDQPFAGENRAIVQSPKVATYDLAPAMSAPGVRDAVLARLRAPDTEDLLIVNFANADMVGHTGKLDAAVAACETVDACVGAILESAHAKGIPAIVFADHGNAEQMWDPTTDAPHTAHTLYDVPCIIADPLLRGKPGSILRGDQDPAGWFDAKTRAARGRLADVLPTALALMGLEKPGEMTGSSLLG